MRFAQAAAEDREVLREDKDSPASNLAVTCDDTIASWPLRTDSKVVATMRFQHIVFTERPRIEHQLQSLSRCQLAFGMLRIDPHLSTAEESSLLGIVEPRADVLSLCERPRHRR